jgi:hypothetical protein
MGVWKVMNKEKVAALEQVSKELSEETMLVSVKNDKEYEVAGQDLVRAGQVLNDIKAFFEPMRKAAKAAYDEVLATRKRLQVPVERFIDANNTEMELFLSSRFDEVSAGAPLPAEPPKVPGVRTEEEWGFVVLNEAEVKPEFTMLDLGKIGAHVKEFGPEAAASIGGIKVYKDYRVKRTGRRSTSQKKNGNGEK